MDEKLKTLHELCDTLSKELEEVNDKIRRGGGMSAGDLETVDKLTHALKSIKTTIAMMEAEDGYSGAYYPHYYRGGRSYASGRMNARRDSMGRYSRNDGYSYADGMDALLDEMRGMLSGLPEDKRRKAERLMDELER